ERGMNSLCTPLILEAIDQQVVYGGNAIGPIYLLAFGIGAAMIDDGNLVDAGANLGQLHGKLGLNAETVGADLYLREQLAAEDLIAGGDVMNAQSGEHVTQQ